MNPELDELRRKWAEYEMKQAERAPWAKDLAEVLFYGLAAGLGTYLFVVAVLSLAHPY
jgi:hypothetical protein